MRIARELHDTVSQTLFAIVLSGVRASSLLQHGRATDAQRVIEDLLQLATAGQTELRSLLADMRPDGLTSAEFSAAVRQLAADARARHDLDVRLSVPDSLDVPAAVSHALMMILREALHNVVKHAAARRVDVVLDCNGKQLTLLINDDGRGFDRAMPRPGHIGLQSMRERATALGGTVAVNSGIGLGTHVQVSIPNPSAQ
jgi:signal transduction histidine kinase